MWVQLPFLYMYFLKYIKMDVTYRMSKLDEECWRGMPSKLELLISWRTLGRFMLAMIALLMKTNYSKYEMLHEIDLQRISNCTISLLNTFNSILFQKSSTMKIRIFCKKDRLLEKNRLVNSFRIYNWAAHVLRRENKFNIMNHVEYSGREQQSTQSLQMGNTWRRVDISTKAL